MQSQKKDHANNLIYETSPYLLQHKNNPVDWYGWNNDAFKKAKMEDKPILLSIGYSACHWCHVMERESFEDEEVAKIMNRNFINIKVDLEERPDIDKIYMRFVQLTAGNGGYPLNVFLTPDQKPFFGGTYFPPRPQFNMPSFTQILTSVAEAYRNKRNEILRSANDMLGEIKRLGRFEATSEKAVLGQQETAFQSFLKTFDGENGGFGGAPKFPPPMTLEFLLRYHKRTGNKDALDMVIKTCDKMAHGGIYDQLGGGFHRYTVDAIWLTPHFEKMLYDNAQLTRIYLHLFQITKDDFYKKIAVETLEYVKREMLDEEGVFYSAQDADSEGIEGKFFVWKPLEIEEILGGEDARIFNFYYDISESGNFEGSNILNIKHSVAETAESFNISENRLIDLLAKCKQKVFKEREKRVKPFRDEKVLTSWNGLMLAAFAEASAILDSDDYFRIAKRNADFLLENLKGAEGLFRTWKDGNAKLKAYLEDYANLADGLFELFQVSGEIKHLRESKRLADEMISKFWDEQYGGFFFTSNDHDDLVVRTKDFYDNAIPAGNSAAVDVLLKLAKVFGNENYHQLAVDVLSLTSSELKRYPGAFGRVLSTLEFYHGETKEIVIIGEKGNALETELWSEYVPNKILVRANNASEFNFVPLLESKQKINGEATAYICENFICQAPITETEDLKRQLNF